MSQGGLSPRVNWKALAKYEFALPPLEEQRRILKVLQAVRATSELALRTLFHIETIIEKFSADLFSSLASTETLKEVDHFGDYRMGRQTAPKYRQGKNPCPYLSVGNIGCLELNLNKFSEMDLEVVLIVKTRL